LTDTPNGIGLRNSRRVMRLNNRHGLLPPDFQGPTFQRRSDTMIQFANSVKRFIVSEDGPTAVEYAVMLALIIVVCLTAIQAVGTNASATFSNVSTKLGGS
jgi:pilus assembly protein Flp/PilA